MNILTICFSFFISLVNPFTSIIDYYEETLDYIEENLEYEYRVREYINGDINIYYSNKLIASINKDNDYILFDTFILVSSLNDDYVIINKYNTNGESEEINLNIKANSLRLIRISEEEYMIISEWNDDIYLYRYSLNNELLLMKHLIGNGKEQIRKVLYFNNNLYLSVLKEPLSGGDYGNGGLIDSNSISLLLINDDLEIIKKISFDSSEINNIELKNDSLIHISLNDAFYLYDVNLNQKMGLKFASNCIFGKSMTNKLGLTYLTRFLKNGFEVYDVINYEKVYEEGFYYKDKTTLASEIRERNDSYYGIDENGNIINRIRIYYIDMFLDSNVYYDNNDKPVNINKYIFSLNNKIERTSFKTIGEFDTSVTGTYVTYYFYGDLELIGKTYVYPYINVRDGLRYNIGYILESNMKMIVNDKEISNNYSLDYEGIYNIKYLIDETIVKEIEIIIDKNQEKMSNNKIILHDYDYYLMINENIRIEYNVYLNDNEEISSFIINNSEYNDYDLFDIEDNNKGIYLYLNCKNIGINRYNVKYIVISNKDNDKKRYIKIDESYEIYGISEYIDYSSEVSVGNNITIDTFISDDDLTLRGIYIDYYKDKSLIKRDIACIIDSKISFDKSEANNIEIGFVCDNDYKNLIDEKIVNLKYDDINNNDGFSINIVSKEENDKEIKIIINKTNNLIEASYEKDIIYKGVSYNYELIIGISIFIFLSTVLFSILSIRHKKKVN